MNNDLIALIYCHQSNSIGFKALIIVGSTEQKLLKKLSVNAELKRNIEELFPNRS